MTFAALHFHNFRLQNKQNTNNLLFSSRSAFPAAKTMLSYTKCAIKKVPSMCVRFFFFFLHFTLTYPEIFPAKSLLQSTWQRIMRGKVLRVPFTSMWSLQGHLSAVPGYMVHHRGKVGGSVQLHWLQALVVGFHHAIDSRTIRVLRVPVLHSREQTLKKTKMLNGVLIFFFLMTWYFKLLSPKQTRGRSARQAAAWHQSRARGTSCRCRSPEWSRRPPWGPWRRRWAGRGSCSGVRWAGRGYLEMRNNEIRHTVICF